ncbi:MAG: nucleotidyltransferase domain-containing protein [Anaerolineales bacterium]|nr:nucleotidyltransferase domain-containing protein [Anaerolineales bacterium]
MKSKVPAKIRNLLKDLKAGLVDIYGDRLKGLYLYGSYARGDYRQGSDVDVMILLKGYKNYWSEQERISQLASDVSLEYDVTVSCIFIKETQWQSASNEIPLIYNIHKEGMPA